MTDEAIELSEKHRVNTFKETAEAAALGDSLIRQIAQDAKYMPAFKAVLSRTGPRALTKLLNRSGVSGEFSDEALCALSMISIFLQGRRLQARLEELIEKDRKQKAQAAKPPAPPPPPQLPAK